MGRYDKLKEEFNTREIQEHFRQRMGVDVCAATDTQMEEYLQIIECESKAEPMDTQMAEKLDGQLRHFLQEQLHLDL